jgi:hypothetical protein
MLNRTSGTSGLTLFFGHKWSDPGIAATVV